MLPGLHCEEHHHQVRGHHDNVAVLSKSDVGLNPPSEDAKATRAFDPGDNIFVQSIQTIEELWDYLEHL